MRPFDWYSRQPIWLKWLLLPIVLPVWLVMFLYGAAAMAFILCIAMPVILVWGVIDNRRFWRKLRKRGQVATWPEVEQRIASGSATLVVPVTPKGPGCSWLIDVPRDALDPQHIVPTWRQYEEQGRAVFAPNTQFEAMCRWSGEHFSPHASSARALVPSWEQLCGLEPDVKQQSILVVLDIHCPRDLTMRSD